MAVGVQLYNKTALLNVDNFLNPAEPTWEKLHHIVMYYNHTDLNSTAVSSFTEMKYSIMNAHNWQDMDNYDTFYTTWTTLDDDFTGVDLSLDHQMGIILYGIAEYYYQSGKNETFVRALFDYWYNDTYIACGNGSYMQAFPYAAVAAYRIYQKSGNAGYETAALRIINDMLNRQNMTVTSATYGGFQEWGGAEYVYLDYTGPAGYALWWMYAVTGNGTYQTRRELGTNSLWINATTGAIQCYKDAAGLYADDDVNTYKSSMLMVGLTLDINTTLTWTAMSHIWQRTTDDLMNPRINVTYAGLDWGQEINTETQAWSLMAWLMWAQYQYSYFGYYVRYFGSEGAITDYDYEGHPELGLTIDLANMEQSHLHFWSGGYKVTSITGATSWTVKAIPSDHLDVTISDMFPADSDRWVFVGERYDVVAEYGTTIIVDAIVPYTTSEVILHMEEGKYDSVTLIGEMKARFSDKWEWIELSYATTTGAYMMTYDENDYTVVGSVIKYKDPAGVWVVNVTFPMMLGDYIVDAQDIEMYMWCTGRQAWELIRSDYFNLYCIGGLTEYDFGGDGNRTTGGDIFELEIATTGSWAAANVTYKNLQHIHMLFHWDTGPTQIGSFLGGDMRMECPSDDEHTGEVTFNMYAVDPSGVWTKELYVILDINSGAVGTYGVNRDHAWVEIRARWYDQTGDLLKTDYFMTYHEAYRQFGFNTTAALKPTMPIWMDLWFNRENASSVVGGRTNAYWHGHKEYGSASWWPGYGKFKPIWTNATQSMFFAELLDSSGVITSARELKLMKIGVNISKAVGEAGCDHKWKLRDFDVFTKQQATTYMEGIDTPSSEFQPAQDPSLPMGGFLGGLVAAISKMADNIVTGITTMLFGAWVGLVGLLDGFFAFFGYPGLFSTILAALGSFYDFFVISLVQAIDLLTQLFRIVPGLVAFIIMGLTGGISFILELFGIVGRLFDGTQTGVGSLINIWQLFSVNEWATPKFIMIVLGIHWACSLDDRHARNKGGWVGFFLDDAKTIMYVLSWITVLLMGVANFFIGLIFTVIEAIPGIG